MRGGARRAAEVEVTALAQRFRAEMAAAAQPTSPSPGQVIAGLKAVIGTKGGHRYQLFTVVCLTRGGPR